MTYLELVNNVLRRLREDAVTSVADTVYSTMIGDLVNDAKRTIEESWDWSALREDVVLTTVNGTQQYTLTGRGGREQIVDIRDMSNLAFLCQRNPVWARLQDFTPQSARPCDYVIVGADSVGDTKIALYPTPDATYTISLHVYQRTADFTTDSQSSLIPSAPIYLLAWAMAAREKGEVGGQTAAEIFGLAKNALADAIAYDSAKNPTALIWYEV